MGDPKGCKLWALASLTTVMLGRDPQAIPVTSEGKVGAPRSATGPSYRGPSPSYSGLSACATELTKRGLAAEIQAECLM